MFIACPHCRYLVATDPRTQAPPAHCTRCGGSLGESTAQTASETSATAVTPASGQSFVSLLRQDTQTTVEAPAETPAQSPAWIEATPQDAATESEVSQAVDEAPVAEDGAAMTAQATAQDNAPDPVEASVEPAPDPIAPDEPATAIAEEPAIAETSPAAPVVRARAPAQRSPARAPGFLRGGTSKAASAHRVPRWQWLALAVLVVALLLQMVLADRARLAADASWRPLIVALCRPLACSVPAWREPQAFVMLDRDVQPLPGAPGVLQARATFRNDARWSQPWPILLVTLKDADGRNLGARAIAPSEYLRGGVANRELAPGQSAQVAVRIREPSANVVAYTFDFR